MALLVEFNHTIDDCLTQREVIPTLHMNMGAATWQAILMDLEYENSRCS